MNLPSCRVGFCAAEVVVHFNSEFLRASRLVFHYRVWHRHRPSGKDGLANLLHHSAISSPQTMSGLIGGRRIKLINKNLGRVLALLLLAERKTPC